MVQQWEYLDIVVTTDRSPRWVSSHGQGGPLVTFSDAGWSYPNLAQLCAAQAAEAYELVGTLPALSDRERFRLLFRRPAGGTGT